jgi:hypothetical protein
METERQLLWQYWANPRKNCFSIQPLNLIQRYFGEKLGDNNHYFYISFKIKIIFLN